MFFSDVIKRNMGLIAFLMEKSIDTADCGPYSSSWCIAV